MILSIDKIKNVASNIAPKYVIKKMTVNNDIPSLKIMLKNLLGE